MGATLGATGTNNPWLPGLARTTRSNPRRGRGLTERARMPVRESTDLKVGGSSPSERANTRSDLGKHDEGPRRPRGPFACRESQGCPGSGFRGTPAGTRRTCRRQGRLADEWALCGKWMQSVVWISVLLGTALMCEACKTVGHHAKGSGRLDMLGCRIRRFRRRQYAR